MQAVLLERVQERAVRAAGTAREPGGDACDGRGVARGRERLAGDVEQLRQPGLDASARARQGQRGLCRDVLEQLALGVAERIRPGPQDLEHAHRAARPADRQGQCGRRPATLQAARDRGLERGVELGLASAHRLLEPAVGRHARAGQLGLQRGGVDVDGASDEHSPSGVENAHEHGIGAGQLRRHACEQREGARIVALACRGRGLVECRELRREASRPDGGVRGLECAPRDLRDAVGQREILGRKRLAGVAAAEDHGDALAIRVAQREREHRGGGAVALERDIARLARDRCALARERARREAAVGAQVPALHPAGPATGARRDHQAAVGLAHGDRSPVAREALGRGAADRVQDAIEVEGDAGQQAGSGAHAVGDRGASPQ